MTPTTPRLEPLVWREETRRLSDLQEYEQNPRTITKPQAAKLKRSLKDNGYHARIAINTDGKIVAGHMRRRAMMEMKEWGPDAEVPVLIPNRPLTPEEFDEVNLRDNVSFGNFNVQMIGARFDKSYLTDLGLSLSVEAAPAEDVEVSFKAKPKKKVMVKCPSCSHVFEEKGNLAKEEQ